MALNPKKIEIKLTSGPVGSLSSSERTPPGLRTAKGFGRARQFQAAYKKDGPLRPGCPDLCPILKE